MAIANIRIRSSLDGLPRLQAQLRGLESKVRQRSIGKATQEAAKVILVELKRTAPRVTGMLVRSLAIATKKTKYYTACRVGQRKNVKRRFKSNSRNATASNINRGGNAAPIHLVENATKPHLIKPKKSSRLVFSGISGTTRSGRIKRSAVYATAVNHPGTSASGFLRRAGFRTQKTSRAAFVRVLSTEVRLNTVQGAS